MSLVERMNVTTSGDPSARPVVLVHGFGCGQQMWRHVAPELADHHVVLLDLVGSGGSDVDAYDPQRYGSLSGYADDLLGLLEELDLRDAVVVGHSVSAMIAVLAHRAAPHRVTGLVLVGPSARYIDDGDYVGGFSTEDIDDLLALMDGNHLGWQGPLAGMVSGGESDVAAELEESFCRTRPDIAHHFASVTFTGDNRDDLPHVVAPTLVIQASRDAIAPLSAGRFVHEAIPGSRFEVVETTGHCPHLSAPEATTTAIREFLVRP